MPLSSGGPSRPGPPDKRLRRARLPISATRPAACTSLSARSSWQPRRSILFAFWDGEEINLLGSRHWVRQPTTPLKNVRLAVNVDMVGRMTNGRLEVAGTRTGAGLRTSADHNDPRGHPAGGCGSIHSACSYCEK